MTNPKIEKVKNEIGKTKSKISEFQAKLRTLEREKISLENEQIVVLVRSERISDAELTVIMQSLRKDEPNTETTNSVMKTIRQEEPRNANLDEN